MSQLDSKTLAYLEREFRLYPHMDRMIALRKLEMLEKSHDENIGGGRGNLHSSPTEQQAIRNMSDKFIEKIYERKEDIENAYKNLDDEQKDLVEMKFWGSNFYTWNELADLYHCSSKTMYVKRYKILEALAVEKAITMDGMYL